ncbi:glycine-rich protein, partial [Kitasatospora sp. NPDC057904]|uniref:glycine-rich protein n=1 Tax=Kitasatospora sp. NPDC057904 TaxID=3346275 RepID=UPI0036DC5A09
MAPVRSLLGGRFSTAMRGVLALLCLVPQGGLALAAAPPAYAPQGLPGEQRALVACTPSSGFTNCTRFTYSGGDQTFTVPAGVSSVYARVFGAGGAGSPRAYYTGQYGGGGGGYTTGTLAVTPGQALTLTVGQGGLMNSTSSTYGGGGAGGQGKTQASGGSGGGLSAVWNGAYGTNPLLIAGGGGGSSPGADALTPAAGGGGGTNGGQDNQPTASGRGGTQTAGGAGATQTACAATGAGSQYQGGRGASAALYEGGGGGGGGYYGGGGGACQRGGSLDPNGMGGGGSGYNKGTGVGNTQTSNGTNSTGNGVGGTSGGRTDAQYVSGSGIGDGGGYADGGNGEIVIEWVTQVGLSVQKTASPTTYVPGQALTYTVVVSNAGPAPAVNAAVRDALPSALSAFTWTCSAASGNSCGDASGTGSIDTTATIAVGGRVTYTVTGTVPSSTTGTLSNTATVTRPSATTDANCGPTCSSTADTPGRVTTGLSVTKTPDKNPYVPGQPLTYTVVVKNDGPSDAVGTSVKDKLPNAIQAFTWTCKASGGSNCGSTPSGTGDIDTTVDIPAGGQVTYTLTGTVPSDANGSLDNRATVTPPSGATDPNCSPKCTSTANPIPPGGQANLVVSKTLLTSPVIPGQQITWQVKVTNNGPSRARNVVVTDQVPTGVSGAAMVNDQDSGSCTITNGTATCPAVEIPVNGTASWTLSGTLSSDATTTPTNSATVTGGPDPSASTRTAVASPTATPSPQANLTISKTLLTSPVVPGAQIQWRVTVTNNGPSRARNVVVTDQVPSGVIGASMAASDGTTCPIGNGVATCPAVEIPAGSSATWTLSGTLDPNATTTPTNTAV